MHSHLISMIKWKNEDGYIYKVTKIIGEKVRVTKNAMKNLHISIKMLLIQRKRLRIFK